MTLSDSFSLGYIGGDAIPQPLRNDRSKYNRQSRHDGKSRLMRRLREQGMKYKLVLLSAGPSEALGAVTIGFERHSHWW